MSLLVLLIICFSIQATMVYTDSLETTQLSAQATKGREIWHENNCQVCHQFYGFGGFLGPDLTNATSRIDDERIAQVLISGSSSMPAFKFNDDDISALTAYLDAMNGTGQGQAFAPANTSGMLHSISSHVQLYSKEEVTTGFNRFIAGGCLGCHFSPTQSTLGATDLLEVCGQRTYDQIILVLKEGKLPKMPRPTLTDEQISEVYVFLEWLYENKELIRSKAKSQPIRWSQVPWWEFER